MTDRAQCFGPVVIGGVGGSGTRVVATFLRELGFYMGDDLNRANDNLWFTLLFVRPKWFVEGSDEEISKGLHLFEKAMISRLGLSRGEIRFISRAAIDMLFSDYLHWGRDRGIWPIKRVAGIWPIKRGVIMTWLIKRVVTMIRSKGLDPSAYIGWGWKEPNSHIYIKYLSESFGNLRYIHAVRHGLDMAYSNNQAQLHNWGRLFGVQISDSSEFLPQALLDYWIKANEIAMTLGKHLLGDRFLVMNFDKLCFAPRREIEKLISFLELSERSVDIDKLCSLFKIPQSLGRYKEHDISVFDEDAINRVRELGFVIDYST
jgi:hypothetical protein